MLFSTLYYRILLFSSNTLTETVSPFSTKVFYVLVLFVMIMKNLRNPKNQRNLQEVFLPCLSLALAISMLSSFIVSQKLFLFLKNIFEPPIVFLGMFCFFDIESHLRRASLRSSFFRNILENSERVLSRSP